MKFSPGYSSAVRSLIHPVAVGVGLALALGGCVDPDKRFREFNDRIIDASTDRIDAQPFDELPDITGTFYLAVSPKPSPENIYQFLAEVALTDNGDGTGTVQISSQPLHKTERTPVGEPLTDEDVAVDRSGQFQPTFSGTVVGDADPVLGADLVATMVLDAIILSEDVWCGILNGEVTQPLNLSLDGSTFAAIRVAPGTVGDDLPAPVYECPELDPDPEPDAGVPDAAVPDASPDAGLDAGPGDAGQDAA
jgi:hypothetical protein